MAVEVASATTISIRPKHHPTTFDVSKNGVRINLAGDRKNWNVYLTWHEWESVVAWIQWRRKDNPELTPRSN